MDSNDQRREIYFSEGIRYISRIIELADVNRLNPTYGCFDRSYWHYRTSDFPSGMYQEAVLPLAIAYTLDHPKNQFFKQARLKELVTAGIAFARRSSHRDGSCDDYFPFERAAGATAFSLYACTEACLLLDIKDPSFIAFLKKRAAYLAESGYEESGTLSNHKALIVLALFNTYLLTRDASFMEGSQKRLQHLLSLQTSEGWFPEYEGCDPGYLTFTIDFLAKYFRKSGDEKVVEPLRKAIEFSSFFMHPDGSYGGEYGSRNTFHFLPHGFELMGELVPQGIPAVNLFLDATEGGRRSYLDDDRIFCHYVYNFLQAYMDFCPRQGKAQTFERGDFTCFFKEAGLLVKNTNGVYAAVSAAKGGIAKIYKGRELVWSDCGFVGKTYDGRAFISQIKAKCNFVNDGEKTTIEGECYEYRPVVFSPITFIVFRLFLLLVGRFVSPNIVRRLLQKRAILKKGRKFPLRYRKVIGFGRSLSIECTFQIEGPGLRIKELWIGSDPTFIYVATSRPYQVGSLRGWIDLSPIVSELNEKGTAVFRKVIA